jgi:hypothetical protein
MKRILITLSLLLVVVTMSMAQSNANKWLFALTQSMGDLPSWNVDDVPSTYTIEQKVQKNIRDMNGDGLINCIDYSVLWYYYDPTNTLIIHNDHKSVGMNHLFVFWKGEYIEPQTGKLMTQTWGNKYNPDYNTNVTDEYKEYAK